MRLLCASAHGEVRLVNAVALLERSTRELLLCKSVQALVALVCVGAEPKLHTEIKRVVGIFLMNTTCDSWWVFLAAKLYLGKLLVARWH